MHAVKVFIRRYVKAAWRHRWAAAGAAWAVCAVGWVAVSTIPDLYQSSARLYIDTDAVLTPLLRGLAFDTSTASQFETLQQTLLSRPNLERVIARTPLDLTVAAGDRQALVRRLGNDIRVTPQARNLFTIDYRDHDPQTAYDVVHALETIFIESTIGSSNADMQNAQQFLKSQIDSYEQQLQAAEQRRAAFRAKYVDVLPSSSDGGTSRLDSARKHLADLQGDLQDAQSRRDAVKRELDSTPPAVVVETDQIQSAREKRLEEAEQRLRELRLRDTEAHPDVIAARALVASLKASSDAPGDAARAGHSRSMVNPVFEQLKVRLVDAESTLASLTRRVGEAQGELSRLEDTVHAEPGLEAEAQNLDRDYNVLRHNYEELLARRESTRIGEAANTQADKVKIEVVDPPQVPRTPVAPNRMLLMSAVFLAGIGGGGLLAVMLSQLERSFRSVDDLRSLGLPVLGSVAWAGGAGRPRLTLTTVAFGAALLLLGAVYAFLVSRSMNVIPHG